MYDIWYDVNVTELDIVLGKLSVMAGRGTVTTSEVEIEVAKEIYDLLISAWWAEVGGAEMCYGRWQSDSVISWLYPRS